MIISQTPDGVLLRPLEGSATPVHVSAGDRDLILDPRADDLQLAAAYERGEINAFEYADGHTYPPNRETGNTEHSDDSGDVH